MTAEELITHFNRVYGMSNPWPTTYEVDPITYAHCCQKIFDHIKPTKDVMGGTLIQLGPNKGLMFKNVELILQRR